MYAVVDVETTGGSYRRERIIEVAIIIFDGEKILEKYEKLINPERPLHYYITKLTGIKNADLKDAPIFSDISDEIYKLLEGKILVAHPAKTDYQYLKQEFRNIGQTYVTPRICTLTLCQTLFPELTSTNLGAMCEFLGIEHKNKHRAMGDTIATAEMFKKLMEHPSFDKSLGKSKQDAFLKKQDKRLPQLLKDTELPEETGVFFMKAKDGEILFIDSADDIHKMIIDMCSDKQHYQKLIKNTVSIDYILTGNKLISELLAEHEKRKVNPPLNKLNRHQKYKYGLFIQMNKEGFKTLTVKPVNFSDDPIYRFKDKFKADNFLWKKVKYYKLCAELCGLTRDDSCEMIHENNCAIKCKDKDPLIYNKKVDRMHHHLNLRDKDFIIEGEGLEYDSKSVVAVENYTAIGYTYMPLMNEVKGISDLRDQLTEFSSKINSKSIVKQFIHDTRKPKITSFS